MLTWGPLTFHWYGWLLGIAVVAGEWLVLKKARQRKIPTDFFEQQVWWVLLGGLIGARLYHVITDFALYQDKLVSILYIWNGGLSIIGAVMGGVVTLVLLKKLGQLSLSLHTYLDLAVFGLPLAQAVGRWGNFINQELYGLPTTLPWAITIEPSKRFAPWQNFSSFHPLFAYEMIGVLCLGASMWWWESHLPNQSAKLQKLWKIGSGTFFWTYLTGYAVLRFWLDFLRIDRAAVMNFGISLGINQLVMIGVILVGLLALKNKYVRLQRATA